MERCPPSKLLARGPDKGPGVNLCYGRADHTGLELKGIPLNSFCFFERDLAERSNPKLFVLAIRVLAAKSPSPTRHQQQHIFDKMREASQSLWCGLSRRIGLNRAVLALCERMLLSAAAGCSQTALTTYRGFWNCETDSI